MKRLDTARAGRHTAGLCPFGEHVRSARHSAGISLTTLAKKLKTTKGYISRLERGKAKPSEKMIRRVARALQLNGDQLNLLAGHFPSDVREILVRNPQDAPAMLRETFGEYQIDAVQQASVSAVSQSAPEAGAKAVLSGNACGSLYELVHGNCLSWLEEREPNSIHAVVTDPPYGLKEYSAEEKTKLRNGHGGVWRIPPKLDGRQRSPVPRFSILTEGDKDSLRRFFGGWARKLFRVLVPGAHVFIATNPLLSHVVYSALVDSGFEKRGEIIRLVQTLRGGDRPKNAHHEFENVTVMPRSCWEPWGLFRKPCEGRVQDNLRQWRTGGLRRVSADRPFSDVIKSSPTRSAERRIAPHPSLKPQAFMRQIVRASLPLGLGIVLDPFMGAGSTIAAACALGYRSIGIELDLDFYEMAARAIPKLASLAVNHEPARGHQPEKAADPRKQGFLFSE